MQHATRQGDAEIIQALHARIHQLEEMLASVGAGGVEPLKPQPQGKQDPVGVVSITIDGPRTTIDLAWNDRLSELQAGNHWLYTHPQPPRQQPTDYQVEQLAHRACLNYHHSPDSFLGNTYTFNRHTLLNFARALREGGTA